MEVALTTESQTLRFLVGILTSAILTAVLWKRSRNNGWALLFTWLPSSLLLLFVTRAIVWMFADRMFSWQRLAAPLVAGATIYAVFVFGRTVRQVGAAMLELRHDKASRKAYRALGLALQLYSMIVIGFACSYAWMEEQSRGEALHSLLPTYGEKDRERADFYVAHPNEDYLYASKKIAPVRALDTAYLTEWYMLPLDCLYFSVITTATVGYGDIFPESAAAKFAVSSHVLLSQLFLIVGISAVVSVIASSTEPEKKV